MRFSKIQVLNNSMMFCKWTGKGYSSFNTIKKQVKVGMLAVIYLSFLGFTQTFAQTDSASVNKKINLEEIEISARRTPVQYSEVGRVVKVITKREIELLPVQSVDQLLEYVANVDVRQRGALGVQADVSVRGGSFDQVMILLNGVNITDPQTGHHNLNLPVDFQSIERVEILEGPGARIYGSSAFSGAINFITGTDDSSNVKANVMAGDHGLYNLGVNGTYAQGQFKSFVAANKSATDGYIDNTDFEIYNLFYQGQLDGETEKIELQLGYTEKGFGANSFYSALYPNQYEQTRTTFASLSFASKTKNPIKSSVYWRRHHDRFELYRDNKGAAAWYTNHNYHLTDVLGANINAVIGSPLGKTSIGADLRSESIWSNVLGNQIDIISAPGEPDGFFAYKYNRTNSSFFAEHSYVFNRFSISGGVMANLNSDLGWKFDLFYGADVSYWINDEFKVFASVNESLRMPTFTDLFYTSRTIEGNPDLKPEEAVTLEGGVKYRSLKGINMQVSGFYREGKNMIDWGKPVDAADTDKWKTSNINNVNTYGIESIINLNLLSLLKGQDVLQSVNLSYAWLDQDKSASRGYNSRYVFDYLKDKFSGTLQHKVLGDLSASWTAQYQDRMGEYQEYDIVSGESTLKEYDPFWVVDLKISWNKPVYTIYAEGTNLFDKKYTDIGQLYQPGRWIKAGVKLKLDL